MIPKILLLIAALIAALVANLCIGEVWLGPQQALDLLFNHPESGGGTAMMLWQIRLPRLLCAALVGIALSVSGYLLQCLSRNYLADPYLTGVSSGAALAVAAALLLQLPFAVLPAAALFGALGASLLVALMARSSSGISVTRLLLAGIAVSAVSASLITLAMTSITNSSGINSLVYWLAGSVSGRGWSEVAPASIYVGLSVAFALVLSKPLRLLALGAQSAASLGLNVPLFQSLILVCAVVLCGAAVSVSGIVGFVGLVAPYFARKIGGDERWHIVASAGIGAILVLTSDLAARTIVAGQELPLGTLLSLVGAPFFLWLVIKQRGDTV